jgi:hypothetical protein
MDSARQLRENAERYLRLSRSVNSQSDIAWLESLADAANRSADRIEINESAGAAEQHVTGQAPHEVGHTEPVAFNAPGALSSREAEPASEVLADRRRPERRHDVNPVLIPLLREHSLSSLPNEPVAGGHDDLSASRGIIIWLLVSVVMWMPLAFWIISRGS